MNAEKFNGAGFPVVQIVPWKHKAPQARLDLEIRGARMYIPGWGKLKTKILV